MALPSDAFGIPVDFDSEGFRNAIKFSMQMGTNPDASKVAKFVKKSTARTYWKNDVQLASPPRLDREGKPLDPDIEVRKAADVEFVSGPGKDVDVALEVTPADAQELPVGNFRPTKVTVTALDVDYAKIKDCRELIYNGDRYLYGYEPESMGLFDVGVYTIIFYAVDET